MSSYDKASLTVNDDGSVDVYIGPDAPDGLEANWIPTAGKDFWLICRFYGPDKPLFDGTWTLGSSNRISSPQRRSAVDRRTQSGFDSWTRTHVQVSDWFDGHPSERRQLRARRDPTGCSLRSRRVRRSTSSTIAASPHSIDDQTVIRMNRDTLYSGALVDISQGATLTLPDAGDRYLSVMIVNNDHYINEVIYDPGEHELTVDRFDTDYVRVSVRTLVDPDDPADLAAVHALQDQIHVQRPIGSPVHEPDYDTASLDATREALLTLARGLAASTTPSAARTTSTRSDT